MSRSFTIWYFDKKKNCINLSNTILVELLPSGFHLGGVMLSTDKISTAFNAIVEEASAMQNDQATPDKVKAGLATIISIAKHQSDIRNAPKDSCKAHSK